MRTKYKVIGGVLAALVAILVIDLVRHPRRAKGAAEASGDSAESAERAPDAPAGGPGAPGAPAAKPALPKIPVLPPSAKPLDTAADFERLRNEHPNETSELEDALNQAFGSMDIFGCLPSFGLKGDLALEFSVVVSSTPTDVSFSELTFRRSVQGPPPPPEMLTCLSQRFGEKKVKSQADAPYASYSGEMLHTLTFHVPEEK